MLTRAECATGFGAAWRVLAGRPRPLAGLDLSVAGFWRSFLAPLMILPLYALHVMAERRLLMQDLPEGATIGETLFVLSRGFAFFLDMAAFPLLMALLARPLGISRGYVPLVVIFNWTAPLVALPLSLPAILMGAGVLDAEGAAPLLLTSLMLTAFWRFRAARAAIDGPPSLAGGIVALDFLMSIVLGEAISRAAGV